MQLYYSPLACSLADHIALLEADVAFEPVRVDLRTHKIVSGGTLAAISAKAYVPVLVLDDGAVLTENIAILDWIATTRPALGLAGPLGRTRLLEALAYIATEIHRSFKPFWHDAGAPERQKAAAAIAGQLHFLADSLHGRYLFGTTPGVADCYLFVMLLWAARFALDVPPPLEALRDALAARPAAQRALHTEGLL